MRATYPGLYLLLFPVQEGMLQLVAPCFKFVESMPTSGWVKLPSHILDEMRSVALHFPLCTCNMRRELYTSLLATNATPTSGRSTRTRVTNGFAERLFHRNANRGGCVRLDENLESACHEAVS